MTSRCYESKCDFLWSAYYLTGDQRARDVALSWAQVARRSQPDSANAADTLAWVYYRKGAYGLAIGLLEDAVKRSPENPTYHHHLGMAYYKNNDKPRAKSHLKRALEIKKDYQEAEEIRRTLGELGI